MTDAVQAIVSVNSKTLSMLQEPRSWWLEDVIFYKDAEDVDVEWKTLTVRTSHSFNYWWYIYVLWARCVPVTRTLSLFKE